MQSKIKKNYKSYNEDSDYDTNMVRISGTLMRYRRMLS